MSKDEYKNLINTYMNELNLPYIIAKQYNCLKQMKKVACNSRRLDESGDLNSHDGRWSSSTTRFERENNIEYSHAFLNT